MGSIAEILKLKGDKEFLTIPYARMVIEGGGSYKELEYMITFTLSGIRCGYVSVPIYDRDDFDKIRVHGGITYGGADHNAKRLLSICYDDVWLGFDAGHWGNKRDVEKIKEYFSNDEKLVHEIEILYNIYKEIDLMESKDCDFSLKTYDFMVSECKSVIDQLIEQKKINETEVSGL